MTARALYHFERLAGVRAEVRGFFAWWSAHGPFPLVIDKAGGLRTDEAAQAKLFAEKRSKAKTLAETPHGRGGAADAYPAVVAHDAVAGIFLPEHGPEALARFVEYGGLAERHGLVWGGRWIGEPFGPNGDAPHVEMPRWEDLPYPPPKD